MASDKSLEHTLLQLRLMFMSCGNVPLLLLVTVLQLRENRAAPSGTEFLVCDEEQESPSAEENESGSAC